MSSFDMLPFVDATSAAGAMLVKQGRMPVVVCVMLVGLGTSAAHASPAELMEDPQAAIDQTTAGVSLRTNAPAGSALGELRRLSGLTWDQLARLFGVSRRSLHFWASGKPMASSNEEHLQRVLGVVRAIDRGSSHATRKVILTAGIGGVLALDLLAAKDYARVRMVVGAGVGGRASVPKLSKEARTARAPLRPEDLISAVGEHIHRDRGRARIAKSVRVRSGRAR